MQFTLEQQDYEALIALARKGTKSDNDVFNLEAFLRQIETANGVTRYFVWVQWQEQDQPLPPTARFPTNWPPEMRYYIEFVSRPVARVDVDAVLAAKASKPTNVMVTKDPVATVGWTPIDQFFIT